MFRVFCFTAALSIALCACPSEPKPTAPTVQTPAPVTLKKGAPLSLKPMPSKIVPVTTRPTVDPNKPHSAPDFVTRGSGVFDENGKRWFYGVGKANGIDNAMRAHLISDRAADAELVNQLRAYNQKALDIVGIQLRTKADNLAIAEAEKAEIVDHWIDHENDAWLSAHRLDSAAYAEKLAQTLALSPEVQAKIGLP